MGKEGDALGAAIGDGGYAVDMPLEANRGQELEDIQRQLDAVCEERDQVRIRVKLSMEK